MQQELWYDVLEDALRATAEAVGMKKLAGELWPEKPVSDAARLLLHTLDPDRPEKLSPGQIALIIRRGREAGCHLAMAFLCRDSGYAPPQPVEPEDERARLQREYIEATKALAGIAKQMERYSE